MGATRLAITMAGLVVVVAAVWILLTQPPFSANISPPIALAIILLLVGIGVMAAARSVNDTFASRRVVHDGGGFGPRTYETRAPYAERRTYEGDYAPPASGETIIEERRYD